MVKIFIYLVASSSLSQLKSVSDPITSVSPADVYKRQVYQDAVAALPPTGQEWALQHFQTVLGAEVLFGGEPNE